MKEFSPYQRILLFSSIVIYMLSFVLPAFTVMDFDGKKSTEGFEAFLIGGLIILGGGLPEWIIWLANPLFILSIFLRFRGNSKAIWPSVASVLLAFSFLFWKDILAAENGRTAVIESRNAGYYFWLISLIIWTFSFKGGGMKRYPAVLCFLLLAFGCNRNELTKLLSEQQLLKDSAIMYSEE